MPSESMAAMVMSENRTCHRVCHHMITIFENGRPMMKPEMTAANRIPDPVAESQLKPNTAASGVGFATTGGIRWDNLFRPLTGNCGLVILLGGVDQVLIEVNTFSGVFMTFLPVNVPQQKTHTMSISQGSHARATSPRLYPCCPRAARCSPAQGPPCPQMF